MGTVAVQVFQEGARISGSLGSSYVCEYDDRRAVESRKVLEKPETLSAVMGEAVRLPLHPVGDGRLETVHEEKLDARLAGQSVCLALEFAQQAFPLYPCRRAVQVQRRAGQFLERRLESLPFFILHLRRPVQLLHRDAGFRYYQPVRKVQEGCPEGEVCRGDAEIDRRVSRHAERQRGIAAARPSSDDNQVPFSPSLGKPVEGWKTRRSAEDGLPVALGMRQRTVDGVRNPYVIVCM